MKEYGILYRAKIINGKLLFEDREAQNILYQFLEGKKIQVSIEEMKPKASTNQHRYYRSAIIGEMCRVTGYTPKEQHEHNVAEILLRYDDKGRPFVRSTAELTREEMTEFIERVMQIGTEIGCKFLSPEDYWYGQ